MSTSTSNAVEEHLAPATERKKAAPIVCAPWCEDGTGHRDDFSPHDQACRSAAAKVTQILEPMWEGLLGQWSPAEVETWAERGPARPAAVIVWRLEREVEIVLTPDEARQLAANLLAAAAHHGAGA